MQPADFENELTHLTHHQEGDLDTFHRRYDEAVDRVRARLGGEHQLRIGGDLVDPGDSFTVSNPGNLDEVIGRFGSGKPEHVEEAVGVATDAFDDWRHTDPADRADIFRQAAEVMRDRKFDLGAVMTLENGKNRTEALADVDEAIDFLRFYARELDRHDGYVFDTGQPTPTESTTNLLRPYGVFAVVAPFNFPLAILTGMTSGALITGNTVVVKPASATPLIAHEFFDVLEEAGLPDGVANLVTGGGRDVGQPLTEHEDVSGVVFTGSREVGLDIERTFLEQGKRGPVIAELGGKNPVIVSEHADLDKAVNGVMMGAFSFSGQKCSATSRVYVHDDHYETFVERLTEATADLTVGPPEQQETVISPIIDDASVDSYDRIVSLAEADGTIRTGGGHADDPDLPEGRYVEPTVVTDIPHEHELATEEHFLPFVTIHRYQDFDEAIEYANDSDYGLCAGLFTEDDAEAETWFDRVESGMCYLNRKSSATTGALVQAQPFGGWKFSGTTGRFAGGYWYLPQFMREQSRTRVSD